MQSLKSDHIKLNEINKDTLYKRVNAIRFYENLFLLGSKNITATIPSSITILSLKNGC